MLQTGAFQLLETTIPGIHAAYQTGALTACRLVQMYLESIEAYDRNGPAINSIISLNAQALDDADGMDAAFSAHSSRSSVSSPRRRWRRSRCR